MSKNSNVFNEFLVRLGEQPMQPIASDASIEALELEISEMEEKFGISNEVDPKEVPNENN